MSAIDYRGDCLTFGDKSFHESKEDHKNSAKVAKIPFQGQCIEGYPTFIQVIQTFLQA
jgi:hypothetical protein